MRLRIINEPKLFDKRLIGDAARYYLDRLLGDRMQNLNITVRFQDNLKKDAAYCEWLDHNEKPRRFRIVIDSRMGRRKTLECLAHEIVHVKQYVKGELKDYIYGNHVRWRGQKMFYDENDDETYFDSPWEIEAYGRQIGLYVGFCQKYASSPDDP